MWLLRSCVLLTAGVTGASLEMSAQFLVAVVCLTAAIWALQRLSPLPLHVTRVTTLSNYSTSTTSILLGWFGYHHLSPPAGWRVGDRKKADNKHRLGDKQPTHMATRGNVTGGRNPSCLVFAASFFSELIRVRQSLEKKGPVALFWG